ncbi:NVEALA domain-containing protein [Bacteroides rodentium]|uniref:NVEALA domain-containing protein n=1 Tax=Bacteroides rodentium TaxID=691816 RepID=UPI0004710093|nr:NVEALA domain-containing protein [Bacteroides rodentium]
MKKKILFISLFLVAAVTISFQLNAGKNDLGSLMLENIDALASGEWETTPQCFGSGSVDCPIDHVKVYFVGGSRSLEVLY